MDAYTTAIEIVRHVTDAGGRAFFVGGWVRDRLLGRPASDIDIEVYGLPVEKLESALSKSGPVNKVGRQFAVYKIQDIDVSLPRTESKAGHGHRGFTVTGDGDLSPAAAARRRDFTVNAIAWNPATGEYVDPYDGQADLEARVLRMVDADTFGDDSLRVLRAAQLAARLEFRVDEDTVKTCCAVPLDDLPRERIRDEILKLLLNAARPAHGLAAAQELGIVTRLFPELGALAGCPQDPDWHPEGDAWTHTLMVCDKAAKLARDLNPPRQAALMLAALCHDLGKPATTARIDGRIRARGHEAAGAAPTTAVLDRIGIHQMDGYDVRAQVLALVENHMTPAAWYARRDDVGPGAFRRLSRKLEIDLLARLGHADCAGRGTRGDCEGMHAWIIQRAETLGVERNEPEPFLKGRDLITLGMKPGRAMGAALKTLFEQQMDGAIESREDALEAARRLVAE